MGRKNDDKEWAELVRGANEPPAVPRERMWWAIDSARRERRHLAVVPPAQKFSVGTGRIWRLVAATAAVLVLGVAIGRLTVTPEAPVAVVADGQIQPRSTINPAAERKVYRLATADLFGRADFRLTDFRLRSCSQQTPGEAPAWAGGMLLQTRLLLDAPATRDIELIGLLEDLELVLAQIVGLSRDNCARDVAWIKQGLQERSTLDRLRMMSDGRDQDPL